MTPFFLRLFTCVTFLLTLAVSAPSHAQTKPNAMGAPNEFVQQVADQVLAALKADAAVKAGDTVRINQIVDQFILPYVNFEKTTRLAAGRNWREATPEQKAALVKAFRGTLARTYSGDAAASDVVVKSQVMQSSNTQPIALDYRLEKTADGWKIYDLNVENIWLIENYRNQFTQEINKSGIDGLIAALNKRAQ
jgi:phospholipid transport system substrate-binding protein